MYTYIVLLLLKAGDVKAQMTMSGMHDSASPASKNSICS
jgi:hypothetical protein